MATEQYVNTQDVSPSQDFLKENTLRFILDCIKNGKEDELPPEPILRKDSDGNLIAIDGHNLLAVNGLLKRPTRVHIAEDATDGLPETGDANITRNKDLAEKFELSLAERDRVAEEGVKSFADLTAKYPDILKDDQ